MNEVMFIVCILLGIILLADLFATFTTHKWFLSKEEKATLHQLLLDDKWRFNSFSSRIITHGIDDISIVRMQYDFTFLFSQTFISKYYHLETGYLIWRWSELHNLIEDKRNQLSKNTPMPTGKRKIIRRKT